MRHILMLMAVMASCMMSAEASVDLQMGYYNSDDDMSMSLEGSNLNFGSFCALMPKSIKYDNGGASNQPKAEYSYSLALNGEKAYSSAETDSGMFSFHGAVRTGGQSHENSLRVLAKSGVKDGRLNVAYGNGDFKVQERVEAENSFYEQKTELGPGSVSSSGFGSTLKPVPDLAENLMARSASQAAALAAQTEEGATTGDENADSPKSPKSNSNVQTDDDDAKAQETFSFTLPEDSSKSASVDGQDQGIKYSLNVQNDKARKQGYVDADVMGLTEAQLATQVKFGGDEGYLFGVKMRGIAFAPINDLSVAGQSTGLPVQTLPPGDVEISYKDRTDTIGPESWEGYPELVEEESEKFDSEYPGKSTPALWYYLNNEYNIEVPVYIYYPSGDLLEPVETYQLGMVYRVREG